MPLDHDLRVLLGTGPAVFSRTTSGTFLDKSTGLVDIAEINLLLRSEEFDNASWTKTAASISANVEKAPDGTLTADKIVEDGTSSAHRVIQSPTTTAVSHTLSCYFKPAERTIAYVRFTDSGLVDRAAFFDLTNAVTLTLDAGITATITLLGDGWCRCTAELTAEAGTNTVVIGATDTDGVQSYQGDGSSGLFIWGAQLEAADHAGPYAKTVAAANSAPRFEANGVLIEGASTNIQIRSEEFDDAAWTKTRATVTANDTTAPDGTVTADKLAEDATASNTHRVSEVFTSNSSPWTFSVYVKNIDRDWIYIRLDDSGGTSRHQWFNVSAGTVGDDLVSSYSGDGSSGVHIWGAQ
jgi:hypothetical protein